jgi:uncharacterized protein YkwD
MTRRWTAFAPVFALVGAIFGAGAGAAEPGWALASASPVPLDAASLEGIERAALSACGEGDAGLEVVAREILAIKATGDRLPDAAWIERAQRAAGEPHPWARTWAAVAGDGSSDTLLPRLAQWLGEGRALRRCGVASRVLADGTRLLVAVAVDAQADLAALPTRARVGQWLTVEGHVRVRPRSAEVVVLGPGGAPRSLLTAVHADVVSARFAPDRPGAFTVQVVADLGAGPRPVLEADVFADVEPFSTSSTAPGEDAAGGATSDSDALVRMLVASREQSGLHGLEHDRRLDAVALAHSVVMSRTGRLAHDAGDGNPESRVQARGLGARVVGENVARAATATEAHRALWASPSHRMNMLDPDFRKVGVGVAGGSSGEIWVTEIFEGP